MKVFLSLSSLPLHIGRPVSNNDKFAEIVFELELPGEQQIEVDCNYLPGYPAIPTLSNGDPGEPGCPDELDILSVSCPHALVYRDGAFTLSIDAGADLRELFAEKEWNRFEDEVWKEAKAEAGRLHAEALVDAVFF